jgi:hypothetical protein
MTPTTFEAWIATAFPWLVPPEGHQPGRDYQNLKAAWDAGHKAAQEAGQ